MKTRFMLRIGFTAVAISNTRVKAAAFVPRQALSTAKHTTLSRPSKMVVPNKPKQLTSSSSRTTSQRGGAFDNAPLWKSSGIFVAVNTLGYVINLVAPTFHYHVDLFGTGAFAAAAAPTLLNPSNSRVHWSSAAVVTWSVKLASFLLFRVCQMGHDSRLDETLSSPTSAAGFWIISAAWGLLCSLPHALGTTAVAHSGSPVALKLGAAMFTTGFLTETIADYQKWVFKQGHPGEFCATGLWSLTQHPNWFGNLLLWSGIFVMNAPALIEKADPNATLMKKVWGCRRLATALLGPAFMWALFSGQATGTILPDALQSTQERYGYGKDPTYTNYIDTTPLIIPNPLSWFRSSAK